MQKQFCLSPASNAENIWQNLNTNFIFMVYSDKIIKPELLLKHLQKKKSKQDLPKIYQIKWHWI